MTDSHKSNSDERSEPPRRFCRECGVLLTEQEGGMCSHCYRVLITEAVE